MQKEFTVKQAIYNDKRIRILMFEDGGETTPRNNLVQTLYFVVDKIIRSLSHGVLSLLGKHDHSHGLSDIQETKTKIAVLLKTDTYLVKKCSVQTALFTETIFFKVL